MSTDEARAAWNQWADQTQAFVEDRLLVERPDGEWATASRDSASAAAAAMAGVTIEGVTCGSTVCVLTIAHELAEANQEFFARFRNGEHTGGGALVRRETLPDGRFVTHIYFARPGEELDFRPEA